MHRVGFRAVMEGGMVLGVDCYSSIFPSIQREKDREKQRETERDRERESQSKLCVWENNDGFSLVCLFI